MGQQSFLLLLDLAIAFCLSYFIIKFVGSMLRPMPKKDSEGRQRGGSIVKQFMEDLVKLLFGLPEDGLYIRDERDIGRDTGKSEGERWLPGISDLIRIGVILALATLSGFLVDWLIASEAAVISIYMLAVLLVALGAERKLSGPLASVLSLLLYDFFFIRPRFIFVTYGREYSFIFLLMCIVSVLASVLTQRLKQNAIEASEAAKRSRLLFETNQLMQRAGSTEEIFGVLAQQLKKLMGRTVIIYPASEDGRELLSERIFAASDHRVVRDSGAFDKTDVQAAEWTLRRNDLSGWGTGIYPEAMCLYLPIGVNDRVYGVAGILMGSDGKTVACQDQSFMLSVAGECALALENKENQRKKEAADVLAKNEQLRANILRTISHDLRTPLTSIYGNASNLISNEDVLDKATKRQMYEDIYDDAVWLNELVENLLNITRIEDKRIKLDFRDELIDDVVREAVRRFSRRTEGHEISIESQDDMLFARMDAGLMVQVISNLISNAVKYTPSGSHIKVSFGREGDRACIRVMDDGPGIKDEDKSRVFDMFYSGADRSAHGARSIGLGLYLCKAIVDAHGSELKLYDNVPHGSVFEFTLPLGEVDIHG